MTKIDGCPQFLKVGSFLLPRFPPRKIIVTLNESVLRSKEKEKKTTVVQNPRVTNGR